jgi:long-chain acyl-CoA synthetase
MAVPAPAVDPPPICDDTQAFQPYTSGSTGRPKGAIMTHRGMLWYVDYNHRYWPSAESSRGLVALPLFHKNALRGTVKPMLFAGGSFVLMPGYEPRAYLEGAGEVQVYLFTQRRRRIHDVPAIPRSLKTLDLSNLKSMTIGSAVVTPELLELVNRALPHIKVEESYGLTEGGSRCVRRSTAAQCRAAAPARRRPRSELKMIDASGKGTEEEGELLIRCLCLPRLLQRAGDHEGERFRTSGCAPAICSPRTRTASSTSAAASTTCSAAAARTSIRARSSTCCSPIPRW